MKSAPSEVAVSIENPRYDFRGNSRDAAGPSRPILVIVQWARWHINLCNLPPFRSFSLAAMQWSLTALFLLAFLPVVAWSQSTYTPYTFTTLERLAGVGGADGTGSAARFYNPYSVAVDSAGNVYVADSSNDMIRKITPAGVVTTLAGGKMGSTDGIGNAARFYDPCGVAVDSAGNVYSADSGNHTIRKITPFGVVTTLAGLAGSRGNADGTGSAARFSSPSDVATDSADNFYVADFGNQTIRKITPAGVVTTLAGLAGSMGGADGTGSAARFHSPEGVVVDGAGNVYVADTENSTIRKITSAGVVTTLAGLAGSEGSANGSGSAARFNWPLQAFPKIRIS
jgi:hypothetical protein